jgi:catechol 2,3-dioxygenase-like lactoylglutathione lyase family enzyme
MTRRNFAKALAGLAASRALHADWPLVAVSGVDHLKLRVASSGASAMFYYGLFGAELLPLRNSTFPDSTLVEEFFLKIGASPLPFLMLSQIRPAESPGLDHVSLLAADFEAARSTLARNRVPLVDPDHGLWIRDADGTLIEFMPRPMWGIQSESLRLPLPANLRSLRPAFEHASLVGIHLGVRDVEQSAAFYRRLFGPSLTYGQTAVKLAPSKTPGLRRLAVALPKLDRKRARRILERRGIQTYGSPRELLFRDPDGNEVELANS